MKQIQNVVTSSDSQLKPVTNLKEILSQLKRNYNSEQQKLSAGILFQFFEIEYLAQKQQEGFDIVLDSEAIELESTWAWNASLIRLEQASELLFLGKVEDILEKLKSRLEFLSQSAKLREIRFAKKIETIVHSGRKVITLRGRSHYGGLSRSSLKDRMVFLRLNEWTEGELPVSTQINMSILNQQRTSFSSIAKPDQEVDVFWEFLIELLRNFLKRELQLKSDVPKKLKIIGREIQELLRNNPNQVDFLLSLIAQYFEAKRSPDLISMSI